MLLNLLYIYHYIALYLIILFLSYYCYKRQYIEFTLYNHILKLVLYLNYGFKCLFFIVPILVIVIVYIMYYN